MANERVGTVYTFGYQRRAVSELRLEVDRRDAGVVDVRLKPYSRAPGWSFGDLRSTLGRYEHVAAFGNLSYKGRGVSLADPEAGAAIVVPTLLAGDSVILLCYEEDPQDCHRSDVARLLADRSGAEVHHLVRPDLVRQATLGW